VRAVLDVNVLISAVLSRTGSPARVLTAWLNGAFDLVVSPRLMAELRSALAYPRIRKRIPAEDADQYLSLLRHQGVVLPDPREAPPFRSADPNDDYLIALASVAGAMLVTGDGHLLELAEQAPIHTPAEFADLIADA